MTKATNARLDKTWKREKKVEKQKAKIIAAICCRNKKEISLFSQKDLDNSDTFNINPDQDNIINLVFFWFCENW